MGQIPTHGASFLDTNTINIKKTFQKVLYETQVIIIIYILYNKPTRCDSGSIVFIKNYKYALHVSDALCVHLQEHYQL